MTINRGRPIITSLKLPFFDPPPTITPHHKRSQDPPTLRYVTSDTDPPPFIIYFSFLKLKEKKSKNKGTHPPITHPPMFLSN